jgi:hypothetical protein
LSKDCWQLTQPPSFVHHPNPVCIPVTFHDYVAQLSPWEHPLFADLQLLYDPYELMQLINLRELTLADVLFAPMTADNDAVVLLHLLMPIGTYTWFPVAPNSHSV